ncbi:MAG: D-aminoacyl-tRNA deacylase [Eggerthellales bacterium]|nr:D-aminoacyl-tRNA deacylase [Eggerthellales bacterium]
MRALIQRVNYTQVHVNGEVVGSIGTGLCVFLGVGEDDGTAQADKLWSKISRMRIFPDNQGKTNLSMQDVGGELMVISQFTLYADCKKGNRPSFTQAGDPHKANDLYQYFIGLATQAGLDVATGVFGADMKVRLENDGPFTIWLDTDYL